MKPIIKKLIICIVIILFIISPFFQFVKSICVMKIYSYICEKDSFTKNIDIDINMPGGLSTNEKDWYPFVMTFNDDKGFSDFIDRDMNFTVLYNFGAFEYLNGASSIYNPNSDYYGAFYGSYFVKELENTNHKFGFNDNGEIDIEEAILPGTFDINELVLAGFGLYDPVEDYKIDSVKQINEFINYKDWVLIDATVTTHGHNHKYKKNYQAYIQYGKPPAKYNEEQDFPVTKFKSRIYVKYFDEKKCTVFLYVIAPDIDTINDCDTNFLRKSELNIN
ncbi:hypothetical protein SH1V18_24980 [Vallitalea longa]|uniref:Uncharacterized protein n=1 Tax=Vallitalea longa TaxID=2936439 RepID=A0A9W6DG22_9FIRM|nr:hypothetical protein [Vallitalea longa]GKX30018.1 hypothetical protein SH1V18_24980 [Vallitalea longa]